MSEMPPSSSSPSSSTPPPPPSGPSPAASSDRQLMLILSYVGLLGLIPLIAKPDDRDIRWHAKNGLLLFAAYFVVAFLWWIVDVFTGVPCAGSLVHCTLAIAYLALVVFAIMKAFRGERLRFPVISDMADK